MNFLLPIIFTIGEMISMDAHFSFINLGEMRLEIVGETLIDSAEVIHYRSILKSNPALKFLFLIEDSVESWALKEDLRPIRFARHIKEKEYEKEEVVIFDWEKGYVFYPDSDSVMVDSSATDVLTLFYKLRRINLKDSFDMIIHAGKKDHQIPCKLLKHRTINTKVGEFETVGIRLGTSDKGIFGKGDLEIWFTDDQRRIPVLVKANFKFGSVSFRLSSYNG